ncbi:hypothetical protein DFH09DRAFT_1329587 [Mycena vulgaris]|nr:hypothetical protein DFH09DRAFT_1329587 [Mycena vulgaris]
MTKSLKGKNKAESAEDALKKKRGSPSDFKGVWMLFLTAHLPAYKEHSKKNTTPEFWRDFFPKFWRDFIPKYWRKFPWRLPLTEELPADKEPEPIPGTAEDAFKALDLHLSEEEDERKTKIQSDTKACWFNRQRPGQMGIHANPYFKYLADMRRDHHPPPKRMADYQLYMQHADFKDKVNEQFEGEHEDVPRKQQLSMWCAVAAKLLAEEPEEVKTRMREENQAKHDAAVKEHKEEDEGLPSVDPEIQQQ